jgi:hypothetical protein
MNSKNLIEKISELENLSLEEFLDLDNSIGDLRNTKILYKLSVL